MSNLTLQKATDIHIHLSLYANCDDVQLSWRTLDPNGKDQPMEKCLGFMIQRQRQVNGNWQSPEILRNRVGFKDQVADVTDLQDLSKPSDTWPFQRYDWTDHGASNGETVRYKVSAVGLPAGGIAGETKLRTLVETDWTAAITVTADAGEQLSVYFNRGTVMSQYVARIAREKNWKATDIAANVKNIQEPLRIFLSGELRLKMLAILDEVIANPFLDLYAAIYELSDPELVERLTRIGKRAHIVLSDGSNSKKVDGHTISVDGNEKARATLKESDVNVYDRILKTQGLGHNKLMVKVDNRSNNPLAAWTGSTNWSASGLCTQLNNGIYIEQPAVAATYFTYWKALAAAGSNFSAALMSHNGNAPKVNGNISAWFTRTAKPQPATAMPVDLAALKSLVEGAQKSILYVMFQPGPEPLASIVAKDLDPSFYVRGVVSTLIDSNKEKFELLHGGQGTKSYQTDLIQPDGAHEDMAYWIKEVTRSQFLPYNGRPGVGFAITHTKMFVIDAFSDDPIVVTGSHNFSKSASQSNDENFVIIRGNKKLAEHYAVACMAMYNHYRWRAYLVDKAAKNEQPWSHLDTDPKWQQQYLASKRLIQHLQTWCS